MIRPNVAVLAAVLLVPGLALAQPQGRPADPTPSLVPVPPPAAAPSGRTEVSAPLTFQEHTGPVIGLAEAVAMANRRNLDVQTATYEVERAGALLTRAWSAFLPRATIQAYYTILDDNREANIGGFDVEVQPQSNLTGQGQISQPLFHLEAYPLMGSARAARRAAVLGVTETRRRVQLVIAQAYYGVLSARRFRDLQVRARENAEEHLRNAEARREAGVGLLLDVQRAAIEVEVAQSAIIQAHATEEDAYDALGVLIDHHGSFRVVEPSPTTAPTQSVEELVRRTRARSDLQIAGEQRAIARNNLTAAYASFAPSLDFSFNVPYTNFVSPFGGGDHLNWNMVFVATLPIFDAGIRYANIDETRALLREAELRERQLANNASLEVRREYRAWQSSIAKVDTAQRQVTLAQRALELATAAYEAGASTNLEVVDAERAHRDAEANLVVSSYESQTALASLLLAAGFPLR